MNYIRILTIALLCTIGYLPQAFATIDMELGMQAATDRKYSEAIEHFKNHRVLLDPNDREALMHVDIWIGLTQAAKDPISLNAKKTLTSAICRGLPSHYTDEVNLGCQDGATNLVISDLNADMIASGLFALAVQQLMLDRIKTAHRYLLIANKVLLEPASGIRHEERNLYPPGENGIEVIEAGAKSFRSLNQLIAHLEDEEKEYHLGLATKLRSSGTPETDPGDTTLSSYKNLFIKKKVAETLKEAVCRPSKKNNNLTAMLLGYEQFLGAEGTSFVAEAKMLAKNMDPKKDCGGASVSKATRKKMGLPVKQMNEQKMFDNFFFHHICHIGAQQFDATDKSIANTMAKPLVEGLAVALEAKRGSALRRFEMANELNIDLLIEYYETVEKLKTRVQSRSRKGLFSDINLCIQKGDARYEFIQSFLFVLGREKKSIEYYEKAIGLALHLENELHGKFYKDPHLLIDLRTLLAERYLSAGLGTKAEQQYMKIAKLIEQGEPRIDDLSMQSWTNALKSYGTYIHNKGGSLDTFIRLTKSVVDKQKIIADRTVMLSSMGNQERILNEFTDQLDMNAFDDAIDQVEDSYKGLPKALGVELSPEKMNEFNAAQRKLIEGLKNKFGSDNILKNLESRMPSIEQEGEFSWDIHSTQVEKRWQLLNQNRLFQLRMAEAFIVTGLLKEAKVWIDRSSYTWEEKHYRFTDIVLAIENYVNGLFYNALDKPKLASQNYRKAIDYWYFNPISALDILSIPFPSTSFLLEKAARHEIQNGDPATAFVYIELARQANLGNPRLYGFVNTQTLNNLKVNLEREYSNLLEMAKKNAFASGQKQEYEQALAQSIKQRKGSKRISVGALLPLYTGIDPMLPWLKGEDLQGFMKRMETFQTLAYNRDLEAHRANILVTEKQREINSTLEMHNKKTVPKRVEAKVDTILKKKEQEKGAPKSTALEIEHEKILATVFRTTKEKASWVDIDSFSRLRKTLDKETSFLSFWLTQKELFVLVVNHDRVVADIVELDEIQKHIYHLDNEFDRNTARKLYRKIIEPYENMLKEHLVVMTNGALQNIPFAALPCDNKGSYLGDRYLLRYAPGIEYALPTEFQKKDENNIRITPNNKILVLAPAVVSGKRVLPETKIEAREIAKYFPSDIYYDSQVTHSLMREKIPQYLLMHFAGHANLDANMPDFSHLSIAKDDEGQSSFYVHDIKRLPLKKLQLVVLSSCESARTNPFNLSNEFSALNGAFLEAGAESVVASQFIVDDRIASDFMRCFYKLLKNGESKAKAIQLTQQYMRAKEGPDPRKWSPFILSGQDGYVK